MRVWNVRVYLVGVTRTVNGTGQVRRSDYTQYHPSTYTWYVPGLVAPMYLESTWDGTGV